MDKYILQMKILLCLDLNIFFLPICPLSYFDVEQEIYLLLGTKCC
jgi:hypothetical protein